MFLPVSFTDRFLFSFLLNTKSKVTNPFSIISSLYKIALLEKSSGAPRANILSEE